MSLWRLRVRACRGPCPGAATLATVLACRCRLGRGRATTADAAKLGHPLTAGKDRGDERRDGKIQVKMFPVQATAATQDLNCTYVLGSDPFEVRNQGDRDGDAHPVGQLDAQRLLTRQIGNAR